MDVEQLSTLISLISLGLVFISPILSFLTYQRNIKKDKQANDKRLEDRFNSIEQSIKELTSSIKLLNLQIETITKSIEKNEQYEQSLNKRVSKHDTTLANHEARLHNLEGGK